MTLVNPSPAIITIEKTMVFLTNFFKERRSLSLICSVLSFEKVFLRKNLKGTQTWLGSGLGVGLGYGVRARAWVRVRVKVRARVRVRVKGKHYVLPEGRHPRQLLALRAQHVPG